jgi:diphthamide biosynthesis protein 2
LCFQKDFLRPIVTPYELEVALQAEQSWTGKYVLDFKRLLDEYSSKERQPCEQNIKYSMEGSVELFTALDDASAEEEDQPMFSLVTGTYRNVKRYGGMFYFCLKIRLSYDPL